MSSKTFVVYIRSSFTFSRTNLSSAYDNLWSSLIITLQTALANIDGVAAERDATSSSSALADVAPQDWDCMLARVGA